MPAPSRLGQLVKRRRVELGIKSQVALSAITAAHGVRVPANTISRLETGATQGMRNRKYLDALAKALGFEGDHEFIIEAYGAKGSPVPERADHDEHRLTSPEAAMIELIRDWSEDEQWWAVRVVTTLSDHPRRNRRK